MASRNKIRDIAPLDQALPNLTSLVLVDNELETPQVRAVDSARRRWPKITHRRSTRTQSLDVLASCPRLTRLCITDNPCMNVCATSLAALARLFLLRAHSRRTRCVPKRDAESVSQRASLFDFQTAAIARH